MEVMKVIKNIYNFIPAYAVKPLLLCVCFNFSVYYGAQLSYKNNCFHNLTLPWDDKIPVIPLFVVIYFGCYIFEYTKLLNGYTKLNKVPYNIAILVNQIIGEHVVFLSAKDIKVEIECDNNELECEIDIQRFIRVIENLVKNAEKYRL